MIITVKQDKACQNVEHVLEQRGHMVTLTLSLADTE